MRRHQGLLKEHVTANGEGGEPPSFGGEIKSGKTQNEFVPVNWRVRKLL